MKGVFRGKFEEVRLVNFIFYIYVGGYVKGMRKL
jgi:hypothetical protein